jgi:hypothetical protein
MTTAQWRRPIIVDVTWRPPVIMDITPPNGRPTAEKAAAGHRVLKRRYQRQRKRRAEENPSKPEDIRLAHLRWRELQRLLRQRYGAVLPDTFEARRDLEILVNYALLTRKNVRHQTDLLAPWMDQDEADHLAAHQRPILHKADDLAHKLNLRYCDRQALAITTIGSVDVDQAERDRLRRQRQNEAKRQKRAEETAPMDLKPKEQKVLAKIDGTEIAVPELTRRLANLKEFKKLAEPRKEVYRVLDHLVAAGLVADRFEPSPHGGKVRFVWRQQPSRV